ncbi:MAG: helix-turn-helix domain-containing protein [Planctomycetales bacterium]|nr:helix-turn-helix domain-containing protein [Planctomycetales bacterium]
MSWLVPPTKRSYPCRGDFLQLLREQRGWTQEELAAKAGYSTRLIRKAESMASLSCDTIADLAASLDTPKNPVYPEDLVSDPLASAKLFIESYDRYERDMIQHCRHVLAEDFVFWCAGDEEEMPIAGTYEGIDGFQRFLDVFFTVMSRPAGFHINPTFSCAGNEVVTRFRDFTIMNGLAAPPVWIVEVATFERGKIVRIENYFDTDTGQKFVHDARSLDPKSQANGG